MKTDTLLLTLTLTCLFATNAMAQGKRTVGVLNIDRSGVMPDPKELGSMVRVELEKTGRYNVIDWYDARDVLNREGIPMDQCYGRTCLLSAGKALNADLMLTGTVERHGERIAITLKLLDVATGEVERANTSEYQNVQPEIQRMLEVSVKRLVGLEPDRILTDNLDAFNEPIDVPVRKANLSGPRFGAFYTDGIAGARLRSANSQKGGFGMSSVVSMIGWQQEVQYVNSGDFQCLFEFLFTGSGLESGRFIPAFSFLNGFRMDKGGWEIAFGPTFRFARKAEGYYEVAPDGTFDAVADWHLQKEWDQSQGPNPYPEISNLDSRGDIAVTAGLVIGAGKTFRSGQLNIPLNVYVIPRREGSVYGLSMGFNVFHAKK